MFSHRPAATTSLVAAPARLRSARFSVADNCRVGGPAALLSGEQSTGECELGLWFRRKSAADSARAAVCDSSNAVVPAYYLSANAPSFHQNFSSGRIVVLQCFDEIRHKMLSARTAHDFLGLTHGERIQTGAFFRDDGTGGLCRVWSYIILHSSRSSW